MTNINITKLREDTNSIIAQIIKFNEIVNVTTKEGNVIILSEEDYNSLMETLYIESVQGLKEDILQAAKEPFEECIPEEKVDLRVMK